MTIEILEAAREFRDIEAAIANCRGTPSPLSDRSLRRLAWQSVPLAQRQAEAPREAPARLAPSADT